MHFARQPSFRHPTPNPAPRLAAPSSQGPFPQALPQGSLRRLNAGLAAGLLALGLIWGNAAWAGYRPRNPSKPRYTGAWASRGCATDSSKSTLTTTAPGALTLLAPRSLTGLTGMSHPTFVWFVPEEKAVPVEFTLFDYDTATGRRGQRLQTIVLQASPGLMALSWPKTQPALVAGKTYVWQVALICSRQSPSRNPWVEATVEVVQPAPALQGALATTMDPLKRAELYAGSDLWYDALAETLGRSQSRAFRQRLLLDLSQLEEDSQQRSRLEALGALDF